MKKRHFLIVGSLLLFIIISSPLIHLFITKWNETNIAINIPEGYTNDASLLNLTKIDTLILVPNDKEEIKQQLQHILSYARNNNLKISIAGAQHSMGGHSIYPDGVLINMLPYKHMNLDTVNNVLHIGAGALWEDAIAYLDTYGKSIKVMQAFSSFSIGGSLSVNGHGWQKNLPPVASTVLSFTLMKSDGEIINCSQIENPELFKLVLGGYGLFGIILDVKIKVVENHALEYKYLEVSTDNYLESYNKFISKNESTELVFGRLRISHKNFLEDAMLNYFENTAQSPTPLNMDRNYALKRLIFRGSVNSEYGKKLRWYLEKNANTIAEHTIYSRNDLLNDHVSLIENKDTSSTDILHEYFIPERNFNQFIQDIKPILLDSELDLLNITIRRVEKDSVTFMNYAKETVYGFVFLFNQKKTVEQENAMKQLTTLLVNVVLRNEGTFYLPYRLHISKDTMRKVYPQADKFFELKKKYDPDEIFSNRFYEHYK